MTVFVQCWVICRSKFFAWLLFLHYHLKKPTKLCTLILIPVSSFMFVNPSSSILKQMNNCVTTNPASTDFCMIMLAPPSSVFSFDQIDESSALEISSHNTSHTKNEWQPLLYTVWTTELVYKYSFNSCPKLSRLWKIYCSEGVSIK